MPDCRSGDLVLGKRTPGLRLLLLLHRLLGTTLPIRIQDVRAVHRRDGRGRGDGGSAKETGRFDEQESANERDREDPEHELGGAPHGLEHEQDSLMQLEKGTEISCKSYPARRAKIK